MELEMIFANLFVDLVGTIIAYLLIPVILILQKRQYTLKEIKKIAIINALSWCLFFMLVNIGRTGETYVSGAFFLWGMVGYTLLKKHCHKENISNPSAVPASSNTETKSDVEKVAVEESVKFSLSPIDTANEETTSNGWHVPASDLALDESAQKTIPYTIHADTATDKPYDIETPVPIPSASTTKKKFCSQCGNEIDPNTKKCTGCGKQYFKGIPWKTAVLIGILAVSCTLNIFLCIDISARNAEMSEVHSAFREKIKENADLRDDLSEVKDKLFDYREKAEFLDEYIVFVEDDGTKLYHKYECDKFKGNYFWAYNTESAQSRGYRPCSRCH